MTNQQQPDNEMFDTNYNRQRQQRTKQNARDATSKNKHTAPRRKQKKTIY